MLVKPRKEEPLKEQEKPKVKTRQTGKKCLCSNCHKIQTYKEITVPIKYSLNMKTNVMIDGIEHVCTVCGWYVNNTETDRLNREIAEKNM